MISSRTSAALLVVGLLAPTAACGDRPATGTPSTAAAASPTPTTNGIDTMSPRDAHAAARAAFLEAPAVRITGNLGDGDSFDIRSSVTGDGIGTMRTDGVRAEFLVIGQDVWFSGNRAFWSRGLGRKDLPPVLAGKYVRTTMSSKYTRDLAFFIDRTEFIKDMPTDGVPDGRELVNGIEAFRFRDADSGDVLLVALKGKPYPLKATGDDDQVMEFETYEQPLRLKPPAADDVVAVIP